MTDVTTEDGTEAAEEPRVDIGGADVPARAVAMPWDGDGAWAVVVQPDTDAASLASAARRVPAGHRFVEAFGDVETTLIYRPDGLVPVVAQVEAAGSSDVPTRESDGRG